MMVANNAEPRGDRGDPWPVALRILTGCDYSEAGLRKRLTDKGFAPERIDDALQRCIELGYLDDARYAMNRATSLMKQGRAVGYRVLADLKRHGISEELAERALNEARDSYNEESLLTELLAKRFPRFDYNTAPAKEKRRVVNFLQRRGFAIGCIMDQLTRKGIATDDENR